MRLRPWKRQLESVIDDGPACGRQDTTGTFICTLRPGHAGPHHDPALESTGPLLVDWPDRIFRNRRVHLDQDIAGSYWLVYDSPDGKWCTKPMRPDAKEILYGDLMNTTTTPVTIHDEAGLTEFEEECTITQGALLIDGQLDRWLAYDHHENGILVVRPPYEDEDEAEVPGTAIYEHAKCLPFPLTFLTTTPPLITEYGDPDPDGSTI